MSNLWNISMSGERPGSWSSATVPIAPVQAALRIDELACLSDPAGVLVWRNILDAVDELQRTKPRTGEGRH